MIMTISAYPERQNHMVIANPVTNRIVYADFFYYENFSIKEIKKLVDEYQVESITILNQNIFADKIADNLNKLFEGSVKVIKGEN